jgi:D-alanyl-D-alanine carboxypeptidase
LGLWGTYFPGTDPVIRGPHGGAYVPWPDGKLRDFSVYNMSWAWAAGELISTAHDLNRFYRALLTGRLLRPALLAEMQATVPVGAGFGYGLGLFFVELPCGKVWGHDGGVIGHTTISWHSPDGSRQVTLAENMNFYAPPGQPHPIDIARANFLVEALCGPGIDARAATAAGPALRLPLTPDLARLPM